MRDYGKMTPADVPESGALPCCQFRGEFRTDELPPVAGQACRLQAVIRTWNEEDIIEAAVHNCQAQGCEHIYLVDNASDDRTVALATAAGAELAARYETERHSDAISTYLTNQVIAEYSQPYAGQNLWWLVLDADELPMLRTEQTLHRYLNQLPPQYGLVGAVSFDHYPDRRPANIPRFHPADFQPYGFIRPNCNYGHFWKYPLLHYPLGGQAELPLCSGLGAHGYWARTAGDQWQSVPAEPILLHHFPCREPEATRARLARLCQSMDGHPPRDSQDESGLQRRYKYLDQIYACRWSEVVHPHLQSLEQSRPGVPVRHWTEALPAADYQPPRWYSADELVWAMLAYAQQHPDDIGVVPHA